MKDLGHLLTFVQGHSDSTFSNFFSLYTARPIEFKFHMEPPCDERMSTNDICRMTKMATMPIYDKNLQNIILLNQKTVDLETWYAALVT